MSAAVTVLTARTSASIGAAPLVGSRPRLRLTRRGRIVLTTLAAAPLVVAAIALGVHGGGAVASGSAADTVFQTETVLAGESLWSIAERVAPNSDPRDVVHEIVALNGLPNSQVQPGQRLAIPLAYSE